MLRCFHQEFPRLMLDLLLWEIFPGKTLNFCILCLKRKLISLYTLLTPPHNFQNDTDGFLSNEKAMGPRVI